MKFANRRISVQIDALLTNTEAETFPYARLLGVAREMFCRGGIHAAGIDRILAEAEVSKMTAYTRFGSKEALLREVLVQQGAEWRAHFFAAVTAAS